MEKRRCREIQVEAFTSLLGFHKTPLDKVIVTVTAEIIDVNIPTARAI